MSQHATTMPLATKEVQSEHNTTAPLATKEVHNTQQSKNIKRVQELVGEYQAGNPDGYLAGLSDDFKGSVLAGLIPGGENFTNKLEFGELMGKVGEYMDVKKFEPVNWRAVGDDVLFNVNWEFVWLPTGKEVTTTALVRKVVKDNMICEKYHMIDSSVIGAASPHDQGPVERVKELLDEYQKGNPDGYLAGVSEDFKGSVLGGLIPGADDMKSKSDFMALMGQMGEYMDVKKFEPLNFHAMPNDDMIFNVNWEFVWLPTGKTITHTAIVRKVVKDNMLCEKYHLVDAAAIVQDSPRDVIEGQSQ